MKKLATVLLALLFAAGIVAPVTSYVQHPSSNTAAEAPIPPTQPPGVLVAEAPIPPTQPPGMA